MVEAALIQLKDGTECPVCFISHSLQSPEMHYSAHERELLAVVFAVKKLQTYLYSCHFLLFTDNVVVKYLPNKLDPNS